MTRNKQVLIHDDDLGFHYPMGSRLSYSEMIKQAETLANHLLERVSEPQFIVLSTDPQEWTIFSYAAILSNKAAIPAAPVTTREEAEILLQMMKAAMIQTLFVSERWHLELQALQLPIQIHIWPKD